MSFNMRCPFHAFMLGVVTTASIFLAAKAWSIVHKQKETKKRLPRELSASILYSEEVELAVELALACGQKMMNVIDDLDKVKTDKAAGNNAKTADWVTATDQENEAYIFEALRKRFPKHLFIGEEESSEKGIPPLTDEPTWIIDPVDGTTNFVHSNPATCVSIGLCVNKRPVLGVVYCGSTNELFTSIRGCGAYLNGKRIHTSRVAALKDALIMTEFGYARDSAELDSMVRVLKAVAMQSHGVRMLGSGVLDLCYVACGRMDAVYSGVASEGWKPWDYAAGSLFVEEAGGCMSDLRTGLFDLYGSEVLAAASESLCGEIAELVQSTLQEVTV